MPAPTEAEIRAMESQKTAEQRATEAATAAKEAEDAAAKAREVAIQASSVLRESRLAGKLNSVPKGSIDLWPELYLGESELAEKIDRGALDGVLAELAELAEAHPTHNADGLPQRRGTVLEAIKSRARKAGK